MKNSVKIAYWDTTAGNPPRIIGQIRGTPTIKFLYPSGKNKRTSNKKKIISDYQGAREWKPMMEFADMKMPNFIQKISGEKSVEEFKAKADKYALPKVLIFSKQTTTSHIVKALSTVFRRRAFIGEVRGSKNNKAVIEKFGITEFPKVVYLNDDGDNIVMEKKPSWNRLNTFMREHALRKPYYEDAKALAILEARKVAEDVEKAEEPAPDMEKAEEPAPDTHQEL
jgi:hypothetical protein